jgi:hypothetical protein
MPSERGVIVGISAAARVCGLLTACFGVGVASSWTIGCTTTAVNFAGADAGLANGDAPVAPSDTPAPDAPAPDLLPPIPDASAVSPREVGPDALFMGIPIAGPSRYVQYKCCQTDGSCFVAAQGDDGTCRDASTWTAAASMDCASQGLTATGIGLYEGC